MTIDNRSEVVLPADSVAVVLGTRPEIIKLGHIIRLLGPAARVIHTGQHYDSALSEVFFTAFGLDEPSVKFEVGGHTRGVQVGEAVSALDAHFGLQPPAAVVVQGDTNSSMAAAVAANARSIPLIHVEAGLRSFDRAMPEEHNRVVTDHLADLCLAPTEVSKANLMREGIPEERIEVTGNTVVEAVTWLLPGQSARRNFLDDMGLESGRFVLSTFHRPENVDNPAVFGEILIQLANLPLPVVLPLHPRSRISAARHGLEHLLAKLVVVEPMEYPRFLALLADCAVAVADSGGIQEEASVVKRPVAVVRKSTERPEVIGSFAERVLPGPDIGTLVGGWLRDVDGLHRRLASIPSPYGDGTASQRSVVAIAELLSEAAH